MGMGNWNLYRFERNHQKIVSYSRSLFTLLYTHRRPTSARAGLAIACCVE